MSPARKLAFDILDRVESGGWAGELLLARAGCLEPRDRALATALVFGVLRYRAQIDHLMSLFGGRQPQRLDVEVRIILRLALYQLRYLDRLPPHAVVSDAVDLTRRAHKRSAAGFVNAVLRKVDRRPVPWPDTATALSLPAWLLERWQRRYGTDVAHATARAFLAEPETYVRIPAPPPAHLELEPTEVPGCWRLLAGDPEGFRMQDLGSQWVVSLLDLHPGLRFLDLCAAPGNKTAQALESGVAAVACDRNRRRLGALDGLACGRVVLDGTRSLPFPRRFDRILVDAPCSGTGTLGRNPEIRWRIQPSDPDRHAGRQRDLLRHALECLAPGGRLVYSTCSLEPEENEQVVEAVIGTGGRCRLVETKQRMPGREKGDGFFAAVITSE